MQETTARLLRLQKQQSQLKDRASEMWRYGVSSLDELDKLKEAKKRAQEDEAKRRAPAPAPDPFDFLANKDYLDPGRLASLAAWSASPADLGSRGETL